MDFRRTSRNIILTGALTIMCSVAVYAGSGMITGNDVNVRQDKSTESAVVEKLNADKTVSVDEIYDGWCKISYDGVEGYVASEYIAITETEANIIGNDINIRKLASTDSEVVGKVNEGEVVKVTGQSGDWYRISYNGEVAYINKSYVNGGATTSLVANISSDEATSETTTYAMVTANSGLKFRTDASTSSNVIRLLSFNEILDVISVGGEWVQVTDGTDTGYVSAEYVSIRTGVKPSRSAGGSKGEEIIEYAKQFMGTPYSYGGTSLNSGVDCSGFVYSVMKHFGISLNRSSYTMVNNGVAIDKSELAAGDLVFFDTTGANDGNISHVGIYMGNGDYIHSSSGKSWGVTISNLNEDYSARTYVCSRRVLR